MSIVGFILKASYQLSRHRIGPLRLSLALLLFALVSGLAWRVGILAGEHAASIGALCLILVLLSLLAQRKGFIVFRRRELLPSSNPPELASDEKVAIRATGVFEVQNRRRYFVEVTADFATMETREHIVMGRNLNVRFLVGAPKADAGWWYIFFKPHMIREIEVGEIHFGLRPRPAIKLEYKTEKGEIEPVYLSFDDLLQMQRVLEDLCRDAKAKPR